MIVYFNNFNEILLSSKTLSSQSWMIALFVSQNDLQMHLSDNKTQFKNYLNDLHYTLKFFNLDIVKFDKYLIFYKTYVWLSICYSVVSRIPVCKINSCIYLSFTLFENI